jgi:transcriptional regulator with XRE-family HTH domain
MADQGQAGTRYGLLLRRRHRLARGLRQEELSEPSGISVRAIANMEHGESARPYSDSARALADALDLAGPRRQPSRRFADSSRASGRNASLPIVTLIALFLPVPIAGNVVTEALFNHPRRRV